jgi:hypothetical protein
MPRLDQETWDQIKAEWIAGLIGINELARTHNLTPKTIRSRAERKGWPPRNEVSDAAKALALGKAPNEEEMPSPGASHRLVLQSFDRVIQLLRVHRQDIGLLHRAVMANLNRVAAIVDDKLSKGQRLTLKQEQMIADILSKSASAMSKLIPLERRAFGLSNEEISEFDTFSTEELDALENQIRRALG